MDFTGRYASLNPAQKEAVDTVEGPVMVIAGPGTGKTELLSLRVANILRLTDALPETILCLTFTESGASAMRERLIGLLGKDAYKVAVHTFHSFGTEVINQFGDFFYEGAHFRPADDLSRFEIIRHIFEELGHANVLNKKMNGEYTYLKETLTVISELKKSGLTSDELLVILDANDGAIQKTEQVLSPIFSKKISKSTADELAVHIKTIREAATEVPLPSIVPLAMVIADSLETALHLAQESGKTTPVTAWRNAWFKKNDDGDFVLKSRDRQAKLRAISSIYEQYLARMSEAELFDFDDMILRVVHAMEIFDELRFNLQEKYQYIMVDEFQDTNMAQMRIVHNLTNNPSQGDTPNIMAVGDDDQAIFSFQGADISNIINFRSTYPKTHMVALKENYRSGESILKESRDIITQGLDRLENHITELDKELHSQPSHANTTVEFIEAETSADERHILVESIAMRIKADAEADIAVLTRKHDEIEKLLPYFAKAGVPVQYERQDNVLNLPIIVLIEQLSRVLIAIYEGRHSDANGLLPQVLTHPVWGISPLALWKLSLVSFESHTHWLDEMSRLPQFAPLHTWLVTTALAIPHTPLETLLDTIIGATHPQTADDEQDDSDEARAKKTSSFISPIYEHFFSNDMLKNHPDEYVRYLEALRAIRSHLRDYRPLETPTLVSFIDFITLHRSIGSGITSIHTVGADTTAVHLMTAHNSKGLEFDTVYITGAVDSVWGERARTHSRSLSYPENLPLAQVGDSSDERLRLFYVAATRARNNLIISYSLAGDGAKATEKAAFLVGSSTTPKAIKLARSDQQALETAELRWYEHLTPATDTTLKKLLMPQLEAYMLSVTHLTNFLDISRGGPQNFLLQNLLRFPQAMSPASAYGSAIHSTLQRAHVHLARHGQRQAVEDILHNFETSLKDHHLSDSDFEFYLQKGSEDLHAFLAARYSTFKPSQKAELNFKSQHVMVGDAHLSGALDLVDITEDKLVTVTDYKTGKPARTWTGKTDYEKIKLHKYKQQLMFYKLLIENARDFRGHTVVSGVLQFIEPTSVGNIIELETNFSDSDMQAFTALVTTVWKRIITLDLPDISGYDQTLKGILTFEQDLIDGTV
jgi:DNA helicase-2/ATP-dependent DNA helicase PcrA